MRQKYMAAGGYPTIRIVDHIRAFIDELIGNLLGFHATLDNMQMEFFTISVKMLTIRYKLYDSRSIVHL